MRHFLSNTKGAVTVFVTLLLIPAILVTGTGVDLARIYAARSMVHDANQLAANSVLTSYDSLLQDLYGLYAVVEKDDNLTAMVDLYVRASLFGEEVTEAQLGEFRLFWGREAVTSTVTSSDPLSNVEVLRRQIEEYAKFRVPVAIVKNIIDRLGGEEFKEAAANIEAAQNKIAVDEQLLVLAEKYRAVYDKINSTVQGYNASEQYVYRDINKYFSSFQAQLSTLYTLRTSFEEEQEEEKRADLTAHFNAVKENIAALVNGGTVGGDTWVPGDWAITGYVDGHWSNATGSTTSGIKSAIEFNVDLLQSTESALDELIERCRQANAAKEELRARLNTLKKKLSDGSCNSSLVANMRTEINDYEKLLQWDFESLANEMKLVNMAYINGRVVPELEAIQGYGNISDNQVNALIDFDSLGNLQEILEYGINFNGSNEDGSPINLNRTDRLKLLHDEVNRVVFNPRNGFVGYNRECYEVLENLGNPEKVKSEGDLSKTEKNQKSNLLSLYDTVMELLEGIADYNPAPGASSYPNKTEYRSAYGKEPIGPTLKLGLGVFGESLDTQMKTLMNLVAGDTTIQDIFGGILNDAANRVLLVGYDTNMFSNWTNKYYKEYNSTEESEAITSLSGNPINAANNYFYLSELEYLYNGSSNAGSNLGAVALTLTVIRFAANYASSYIIPLINSEILSAASAVAAIPFAGVVLQFFVRPLYVFAESAMDVSRLRTGHAVPLLKQELSQWTVAVSSLAANVGEAIAEGVLNTVVESTLNRAGAEAQAFANLSLFDEKEHGLLYVDYITLFLLAGNPDTIAFRTGDLIALNVTTAAYQIPHNDIDTDADERAAAIGSIRLFDLSKSFTAFEIKTQSSVRFAFLSMPFAQAGVASIVPPKTFPVIATDYRGY